MAWFYLYKALLPVDLAFVYPQWHVQAGNLLWWLPLLVALIVTAALWIYRESWSRPLLFAWGFFCMALLPVMGLIDVAFMRYSLVADHYQHIALIGVVTLVAAIWSVWHQRARSAVRRTATIVAIAAIGSLMFLTWRQSGIYHNEITVYRATLDKNPECYMAHINVGIALDKAGQPNEVIEHCRQALVLKPYFPEAHNNLGNALAGAGQLSEAIEQYRQAIEQKPNYAEAYNNLANLLKIEGQYQQAIELYEKALRLNPDFFEAHINLGLTLVQAGRSEEAIKYYEQALSLKSDSIVGYYNLALAYANIHQSSAAVAAAQRSIELAQSQGQTALAKQIEDWLNSYRAGLSELPNTPPSPEAGVLPP